MFPYTLHTTCQIFFGQNVAALRIEYVRLKDVPCICKNHTDMTVHAEKWLVVASTAHVLVIVFTVHTAVRTSVILEKSAICYWRWRILKWRRDLVLSLVCRKQRSNEGELSRKHQSSRIK